MKIVAVVGSGSGSGKTTLACAILEAFPGLGAVKISARDAGESRVEWGPGAAGKDTALYAASGALVVARIVAPRARVAQVWEGIAHRFSECRGVVMEGTGALACEGERLRILLLSKPGVAERPSRAKWLAGQADFLIAEYPTDKGYDADLKDTLSHFNGRYPPVIESRSVIDRSQQEPQPDHGKELLLAVSDFLRSRNVE